MKLLVLALLALCGSGGAVAQNTVDDGACNNHPQIKVESTVLPATTLADVHWIEGTNVAFVMTTHPEHLVYRSDDNGKTWTNQLPFMVGSESLFKGNKGVIAMAISPSDPKTIYFLGYGGNMWVTKDAGLNGVYTSIALQSEPRIAQLSVHPTEPGYVLMYTLTSKCYDRNAAGDCYSKALYTKDFGASWTVLDTYIRRFSWADAGLGSVPVDTVWLLSHKTKTGDQRRLSALDLELVHTDDFLRTKHTPVEFAVNFLFYHKVHYVVVIQPGNVVRLTTSEDNGKTWHLAEFPFHDFLSERGYWILDDATNVSTIGVRHSNRNPYLNLYTSGSLAEYFGVSMRNMAIDLNVGRPHFQSVQGLKGVYLANQYQNLAPPSALQTKLSFNTGGNWDAIAAPANTQCADPAACWLHLHASGRFHTSNYRAYGPLYSSPHSVGMILANGNTGAALSMDMSQCNTYYSRDAGRTWNMVVPHPSVYDFADHGGLMLFARTDAPSSHLAYTTDEGTTVSQCVLGNGLPQGINVFNILAKPGGDTQQFIVHGQINASKDGVLLHVDFSGLNLPRCQPSDFEQWSPGCIDGVRTTYLRRKASSSCFDSKASEPVVNTVRCPCTEADWECDVCFSRVNGICSRDSGCTEIRPPCTPGASYNETRGYRLIAGNQCDYRSAGAVTHWARVIKCPGGESPSTEDNSSSAPQGANAGVIVLIVFIILAIIGALGAVWWFKVRPHPAGLAGFIGDLTTSSSSGPRFEPLSQDDGEFGSSAFDDDLLDDEGPEPLGDEDISSLENASSDAPDLLG